MKKRDLFLSLLLSLVLVFPGCANLEKIYPDKNFYVLDVSRNAEALIPIKGSILKVRPVQIAPYFESRELVYRKKDLTFESDFYNQFFASPRDVITEEISEWFKKANLFEHVLDTASALEATHILEVEVLSLYGDYSNRSTPKAIIDFKVILIDNSVMPPKIIFDREYPREVILDNNIAPQKLIEGWSQGLNTFLVELETELSQL